VDNLTNAAQRGYASSSGVGTVGELITPSTERPQSSSQGDRRARAGQTTTRGVVHTRYDDDEESYIFSL